MRGRWRHLAFLLLAACCGCGSHGEPGRGRRRRDGVGSLGDGPGRAGAVRPVGASRRGPGTLRGPSRPHRHPDARGRGARPRAAGRAGRRRSRRGSRSSSWTQAVAQADLAEKTATPRRAQGRRWPCSSRSPAPRSGGPTSWRSSRPRWRWSRPGTPPIGSGRSLARHEVSEQQLFDAEKAVEAGPDPAADGRGHSSTS